MKGLQLLAQFLESSGESTLLVHSLLVVQDVVHLLGDDDDDSVWFLCHSEGLAVHDSHSARLFSVRRSSSHSTFWTQSLDSFRLFVSANHTICSLMCGGKKKVVLKM